MDPSMQPQPAPPMGPEPAPMAPQQPAPMPPPAPPPASDGGFSYTGEASASGEGFESSDGLSSEGAAEEPAGDWRADSLHIQNTIGASTGLLRVREAGSGAPGTFRFSLWGSYFSGSGFLCGPGNPCVHPVTGVPSEAEDDATKVSANLGISATVTSFLEAYMGFYNSASSNNRLSPELLQVLGDMNLGLKGFMPKEPDSMFFFGGEAELLLLMGTGGIGVDGAGTGFALRGVGTMDLNNHSNAADNIPLRAHLNLGYKFDNSGKVVEDIEGRQPPDGRGGPITRVERFGLNINRVDAFQIGLGAEYIHAYLRPFLEWTIDVPVNRQGYVCNIDEAAVVGDKCLGEEAGFSTSPSRLSLGTRVFPWQGRGLSLNLAVDIGTGGTSTFLEEVAPEAPWNFWFGFAYAVDTQPPAPIIERVEVEREMPPPAPIERYISGTVVDKTTRAPVPDAIVRYEGRTITGMVTGTDGTFQTINLDPGSYTFNVTAEGYKPGQCVAVVPGDAGPMDNPPFAPAPATQQPPGMQPLPPQPPPTGQPEYQPLPPYQPQLIRVAVPGLGQVPPPPMPPQPQPQPQPGMQPMDPAMQPLPPQPPPQPGMQPYPGAEAPLPPPGPGMAPAPGPQVGPGGGPVVVRVECEIEALPKVGNVLGSVLDSQSSDPIVGAKVTIQDKLKRELALEADEGGAFRFENVPAGVARVTATAPGYLTSVSEYTVEGQKDLRVELTLNKRPERPKVVVTAKEIKLAETVHFQHDSAEILPDSMAIVEEIADVMVKNPKVALVEIQGHTDNTGSAPYNLRLSQERAEAVKEALMRLGIEGSRLTAKGYGQEKPLLPNVSDANRARNRRVQLMILKRE